jgi:hypothetical protein
MVFELMSSGGVKETDVFPSNELKTYSVHAVRGHDFRSMS